MTNRGHEAFIEHGEAMEAPSNRSFGLTVGGILLAIALLKFLIHGTVTTSTAILLVVGAPLVVLGIAKPSVLTPLNWLWMKLGLLMARIVNPVIMFLMFIILFVPIALVMRVFRRDALRMRRRTEAASYWIDREPPGPTPQSIIHQF